VSSPLDPPDPPRPDGNQPAVPGEPGSQSDADLNPERDLAGALHEVSNALTVVLGWLEALRDQVAEGDPARRAVDIAWSRAKLGRQLARKAIGNDFDLTEEVCPLEALVRDAAIGVEREASSRKMSIRIAVEAGTSSRVVHFSPALLQVLTNLLLNAIGMSPDGSTVDIEVSVCGETAVVSVVDQGPGVDPQNRGAIFKGRLSQRPGGAGVGLRHARSLARSKGGSLEIGESDRGARFLVRWPLAPDHVDAPPVSATSAALQGLQILLVEDDDAVIGLLSTALSLRGAHVVAARNAGELMTTVAQQTFDAALVDLSPIEADIRGSLDAVRDRNPGACLVVISGSAVEVPALGVCSEWTWVRKPFEVGEILAVLVAGRQAGGRRAETT
jgi:ActR/RegA family two-component response regulator